MLGDERISKGQVGKPSQAKVRGLNFILKDSSKEAMWSELHFRRITAVVLKMY